MLRICSLLFFYFFTFGVQASDPFDKRQRNLSTDFQKDKQINNLKNTDISNQHCMKNRIHQATDIPFSELILIGIIEDKERKKALFIDEKEHFFSLSAGEIISKDRFILKDIYWDKIDFQSWGNKHCALLEAFTLRL